MAAELRQGENGRALLSGVLDRDAVTALWPQLQAPSAVDIQGLTALDSSGLALLSQLASSGCPVIGSLPALAELATAYRLPDSLVLTPPPVPAA